MNALNMPSEETFLRVAGSLEKLANTRIQYDYSNSPGRKYLLAGNQDAGLFGFVSSEELITGLALAAEIGLTNGTSQFSDTPWIKYLFKGKVCFTPLKTIRHTTTWDAIYNAGAVYGRNDEGTLPPTGRIGEQLSINAADNSINTTTLTSDATDGFLRSSAVVAAVGDTVVLKGWSNGANNGEFTVSSITANKIVLSGGSLVNEAGNKKSKIYNKAKAVTQNRIVTIDGLQYRVRLFRGADNDPMDSSNDSDRDGRGPNDEWNQIILQLHEQAKLKNWAYPAYVDTNLGDFETYLTDADLMTHNSFGTGSYTWCQETRDGEECYRRVLRGGLGASLLVWAFSWIVGSNVGWRPVLELLG